MTDLTVPPGPPRSSWAGLRARVADHPVATQLIFNYGVSWPVLIPVVLAGLPVEPFLLIVVVFGQLLPPVLIAAAQGGRPAVRRLFGRIFRWRVSVRWYLLAFLLIPVSCLAMSTAYGYGNWTALFTDPSVISAYLMSLTILPIVNLWEEAAWTDTVQHNLARRRGPLMAAVITGPLFGLVHLPLRLTHGVNREMLVNLFFAMMLVIGLRVLIGWLYYSTGRSILIAAIVHVTFNATNNGALLLHVRPDSLVVQNLAHFVVAALGVVVIVATRGRLGVPSSPAASAPVRQPSPSPECAR